MIISSQYIFVELPEKIINCVNAASTLFDIEHIRLHILFLHVQASLASTSLSALDYYR